MPITPADELSSKTPTESRSRVSPEAAVISPAPVETKDTPPVPDLIATEVAPVILPSVLTLAPVVARVTAPATARVPVRVASFAVRSSKARSPVTVRFQSTTAFPTT